MTFQEICRKEPRLLRLWKKAKSFADDRTKPSFCPNDIWYGYGAYASKTGLRSQMERLVGWFSDNPELDSSEAFDVAHWNIYWDALPDCRNCGCLSIDVIKRMRSTGGREKWGRSRREDQGKPQEGKGKANAGKR